MRIRTDAFGVDEEGALKRTRTGVLLQDCEQTITRSCIPLPK